MLLEPLQCNSERVPWASTGRFRSPVSDHAGKSHAAYPKTPSILGHDRQGLRGEQPPTSLLTLATTTTTTTTTTTETKSKCHPSPPPPPSPHRQFRSSHHQQMSKPPSRRRQSRCHHHSRPHRRQRMVPSHPTPPPRDPTRQA